MRRGHILLMLLLLGAMTAAAQSFESLKRSKGKSELYTAVEQALTGSKSVSEARQAIATGDWKAPYNGKTPIYLVMDFLATHPKNQCSQAEQILEAFLSRKDFDINLRHGSLVPPFAYLIRQNYDHLGGHFSSNYISDSVLKMMIEAGASVNTYNTDGGTLMSFAMDTKNAYLQSYFIKQGIDLRHTDEKGEDDMYRLIAENRLDLLRQAKQRGTLNLDINTLKNEPKSFAHHKELYDFIADHCASQAKSYEDLTLFRKRFSDKKSLVKQKYETMARQETNAAKDFKTIYEVIKRYPDLESIYGPKRLTIYRANVSKLDPIYRNALSEANSSKLGSWDDPFVQEFIDMYSVKTKFDPDGKVSVAKETADFYVLRHALNDSFHSYIGKQGITYSRGLFGIQVPHWENEDRPAWDSKPLKTDRKMLSDGRAVLQRGSRHGFARFYQSAASLLSQRERALEDWIRSQERELEYSQARYDGKKKQYYDEMCENCKIDGEKTTFPKGFVEAYTGLFWRKVPAQSEESGRLVLKNGLSTKWKYIYENSKTYIEAEGGVILFERYDNVDEMVKDIIDKCRSQYCK